MLIMTAKALQIIGGKVYFQAVGDYPIEKGGDVRKAFYLLLDLVLLKNKRTKKNKKFLKMLFNPVNYKLNNIIKSQRMT